MSAAPFVARPAPVNVRTVAATLYACNDLHVPVADVFDPAAVSVLAAAPQMAGALRSCLALLRDPAADKKDAALCEYVIRRALIAAGEPAP